MYSVVTIICVDSIYTLCVCVKRGYVGPPMVPGSWDGARGIFVFLNTFVLFFSLARFGFSKKSDEKQRSNKVHPYASEQLRWHIWPTFPLNFFMTFAQTMHLYFFYTMLQKSKNDQKTQIKGGGVLP